MIRKWRFIAIELEYNYFNFTQYRICSTQFITTSWMFTNCSSQSFFRSSLRLEFAVLWKINDAFSELRLTFKWWEKYSIAGVSGTSLPISKGELTKCCSKISLSKGLEHYLKTLVMIRLAIEFSAAHWWSVRARGPKVWGSIYHGNSDFFSAPRLWRDKLHYLKITHYDDVLIIFKKS